MATVSALLHLFVKLELRMMPKSLQAFFQLSFVSSLFLMLLQLGAYVPSQMFLLNWEQNNSRLENEHLRMSWGFCMQPGGKGVAVKLPVLYKVLLLHK